MAGLGASVIAVLWLVLRCISDPCYLYIHGGSAVADTVALLAGWLFIFLAGDKYIRILLLAMSLFALVFIPIGESNIPGTASSLAARTLRLASEKIEAEHDQLGTAGYPTMLALAPDETAKRFYDFHYVPLASKSGKAVDGYLLKARPLRYGCGITRSFLLDRNGRFHTTQEDRDATETDPILD